MFATNSTNLSTEMWGNKEIQQMEEHKETKRQFSSYAIHVFFKHIKNLDKKEADLYME